MTGFAFKAGAVAFDSAVEVFFLVPLVAIAAEVEPLISKFDMPHGTTVTACNGFITALAQCATC